MGTQTKIADKIIKKNTDYVLAVKGNQETLNKDLIAYFDDIQFRKNIIEAGNYKKLLKNHMDN